ncbi:hypothetical protein HHK36_027949 [Tetracentron sinense]|uniref:Uncharacterized protein n=1 Tax=Tetracentron sinense TaxID=13715 RepID=A0A834YEX8_TETSI|nr:hypothetical protein HHK36_027949 [Tetracentron sinense]
MWRRVISLSPLLSSPKSSVLDQAVYRLKFLEVFTSEILTPLLSHRSLKSVLANLLFLHGRKGWNSPQRESSIHYFCHRNQFLSTYSYRSSLAGLLANSF